MILQIGSKGPEVLALQNKLIKLGYPVTADGLYGQHTADAVTAFQADNHLQQDGVAGPDTMAVLDNELASADLRGIDVSNAQGVIDWDAVKASGSVQFAILKCTEGGTYRDPRFNSNLSEVQRVGIPYGAYHFFRFFSSDPLPQAANLKATAGPANFGPGTFPIIVDVEYQDVNGTTNAQVIAEAAQCAQKLQTFITQVTNDFGRTPMIYTNADFWNNVLKAPAGFNNLKLWVADYRASQGPALPKGWADYNIWQYSSTTRIPGINSDVDMNIIKGNLGDLIK